MEVHPPHAPIHSWRDFALHIITITIGLLIALGLEAFVEAAHHRHLLHTAEINLSLEISRNHALLAKDERQLTVSEQSLTQNLKLLNALKAHIPVTTQPQFNWYWDGMQTSAWDTARDTGAIALMPYERAQSYSIVYGQQAYVDQQAATYIRGIYRSAGPLQGGRNISTLSPAELDAMIANTEQSLVDIKLLHDLSQSLEKIYVNTDGKL